MLTMCCIHMFQGIRVAIKAASQLKDVDLGNKLILSELKRVRN